MKKLKKLIPAFCMLLVSVAMLGTSTFAWFSMNKEVSATGMKITAQSDNIWLVINSGDQFDKTNLVTTVSTNATEKKLLPVAPKSDITTATAATYMTTASNWYYSYSKVNDKYKGDDQTIEEADKKTCTTLEGYIASETFSIGLNEKSGASKVENLKIKTLTVTENIGLKAVFVCGTKVAVAANDVLATEVTATGVVVTVYYYIDGNDENVYTNNIDNLTGNISVVFSVD